MEVLLAVTTRQCGAYLLGGDWKSWGADMCTSIFQGNTGDLEQVRRRSLHKCPLASLIDGEDFSQPLSVC